MSSIFSLFLENEQKEENDKTASKPKNSDLLYKLSNDVQPTSNSQDFNSMLMNSVLDENNSGFSSSESEPGFPEHKESKEDHLIKKYNKATSSIEVTTKDETPAIVPSTEVKAKKTANAIMKSTQLVSETPETPLPPTPAPTPCSPQLIKEDVISIETVRDLVRVRMIIIIRLSQIIQLYYLK